MKSVFLAALVLAAFTTNAHAASLILNEYNAVGGNNYLQNPSGSDTYWGRVTGNGGDWFELVVIDDHLDIRGWQLEIYHGPDVVEYDETLNLSYSTIWSDLRSGTIITVSEDLPDDISYDPIAGDWWINVQANDSASGLYIEPSNFPVNSDNWELIIKNRDDEIIFGPVGERTCPNAGVNNEEIFRLEASPSASISADSVYYDDGSLISTFAAPNQWGVYMQDFSQLRSWVPEPSSILLLALGGLTITARKHRK